jgi:hypothetical protein
MGAMRDAVARARTGFDQSDLMSAARALRRVERRDRLIASMLAMLLIAGWALNFVEPRQLALHLNGLLHAVAAGQV